ncbi:MAG TPA: hypothetical protein VN150_16035 [Ochrobactrum sp.]|nr:hypothetical protein [Ochrobactrum sp.]
MHNGKKKKATLLAAVIRQLGAQAGKGNIRATKEFLALYAQHGPLPPLEVESHDVEQDAAILNYFLANGGAAFGESLKGGVEGRAAEDDETSVDD